MRLFGFSNLSIVGCSLQFRSSEMSPVMPSALQQLHRLMEICSRLENKYPSNLFFSISQRGHF
jgi:hypothetical protein